LAKKKGVERPPRVFTKRQISSIKRQKRRQNIILYGGVAIIVAVVIVLAVGVYLTQIGPYHQKVIKVYDREFSARYFMDTTEYVSQLALANYQLTVSDYQLTAADYQQLFQNVPYFIEQSELMKMGALELGITVSNDEAKEYLEEQEDDKKQERTTQLEALKEQGQITEEGYLLELEKLDEFEIPVSDASMDLARADLLRDRVFDEYIKPDIPIAADQVNTMVMLLESENQANDIIRKLDEGGEFTALAEEYSLDDYSKEQRGDLGWHIREVLEGNLVSTVPVDYAFDAEAGTLSQPVCDENLDKSIGYWIVNILEREGEDQANIQVILVGSQWEADIVIQRIISGDNFGELAREFSQDEASKEQGGELGVVTKGQRTDAFDTYVFGTEISGMGILGPFPDEGVTTQGGYWLIKVVDREDSRPIEEEDREYLESVAYYDWILQLWEDATDAIDESNLTLEVQQWMLEKLAE
jgi:parvulin-like peptidyl-prolyl isomerase